MSNLVSPGVDVQVIDESFFTPAGAGTTPMIFVVSAENKTNSSGTGIARGTLKRNAGVPFLLTSQRDLADTFGDPVFQVDQNNNPIHAGELNEYGLQAAFSVLGVSNRAFVTRADIDLAALEATPIEPSANPADGTYWLDAGASTFGIFEWNGASRNDGGQAFEAKQPIVITSASDITTGSAEVNGTIGNVPKGSVGAVGDYAIVFTTSVIKVFYRNSAGIWVLIGSDKWVDSQPTVQGTATNPTFADGGTFELNDTVINIAETDTVQLVRDTINGAEIPGVRAVVVSTRLVLFSDGTSTAEDGSTVTGEIRIAQGTGGVLGELGINEGTYFPPALNIAPHTQVPRFKATDSQSRPTGSVWIKSTEPGGGARWRMRVFNDATQQFDDVDAPLFADNAEALFRLDRTQGGINIPNGAVYINYNAADDEPQLATFKAYRRRGIAPTSITGTPVTQIAPNGDRTISIEITQPGTAETTAGDATFTPIGNAEIDAENFANAVNSLGLNGLSASVDSQNRITLQHATGGDIGLTDDSNSPTLTNLGFSDSLPGVSYVPGTDENTTPKELSLSLWTATLPGTSSAFYTASNTPVTALTASGTLWFNSIVDQVDIMVHDGNTWVGYRNEFSNTDSAGPIVSASVPTSQRNGDELVTGDIWIDTSDIENYPDIYKFNAELENTPIANRWIPVDASDQTSEEGIVFADARWSTTGGSATDSSFEPAAIEDLLVSDFIDFDAPDPALFPRGMLLWNLRRSGFNVKRFERNYVDQNQDNLRFSDEAMTDYYPHRWVTESANQADGSGSFGTKAQRKVVIQAIQAMLNSNDDIRDTDSRAFNLVATPGYPEVIAEMITLNFDRGLTGFVVGDSPARLRSDATSLNRWATNQALAPEDGLDGLVSRDEFMAVFYPWGFTSDNFGNNVVVPPSHMMLRTLILSDQVSFPWFAPAGIRRGGITNATSVGFVDNEGGFVSISLNEGQRDTLYENNVNPITFISGAGLVNFGQKTRARGASALDRINVARLVIFLRQQLSVLAQPYVFEQNDKITRDEIKQAVESLILELVGQRAVNDFIVVCDESNNTPARIDRSELYVDVAIEPTKAAEFIFIPLRLKNTGEISGL